MKEHIFNKVKKYIGAYRMIEPEDCVVAGISGGADSVCMLHLLKRLQRELPFRLVVVHVNHGLRAEAGEDAEFVEKLCEKWELPFLLREVDMEGYAAAHRMSSEEAGRILRYQAFQEVLKEVRGADRGRIAVAHNADDRAETMLFHMFRGSGLKGLGSIRPVRESVIRPLLSLGREQIEAYLNREGLVWREDITNGTDLYARNRIRRHILPYVKQELCHGAVSHMGELADILTETEDYLERETGRLYDRYAEEDIEENRFGGKPTEADGGTGELYGEVKIRLEGFLTEDVVMKKRIFLHALERITPRRKDITVRHIAALMELAEKEGSKELFLPYGIRAVKEYGTLFLRRPGKVSGDLRQQEEESVTGRLVKADGSTLPIPEGQPEICVVESVLTPGVPTQIALPDGRICTFILWETDFLPNASFFYRKEQNIPENRYTKWFDYDKITTSLILRTRRTGDYITIDDALHTQSVKQYMINEKIPKSMRGQMYLLADGAHILWVPGYRVSRQYRVEKSTRRILEVRLRGGNDGGENRGIVDGGGSR